MFSGLKKPWQFLRALDSAPSAIIIVDALKRDHPIRYSNRAFQKLTGYSLKDCEGKNCRFLQRADRRQPGRHILHEFFQNKIPTRAIFRNYRKNGLMFWNELFVAPMPDATGKVTHYIGLLSDVSQQMGEGQKMRERRLNQKNAALREMLKDVESERDVLKRQVVANIEQAMMPLLRRLEQYTSVEVGQYTNALKDNLGELASDFGLSIARPQFHLSSREIEVCHHVRRGLQTKDIASLLNTSPATIENQRNSIRRKLGLGASTVNLVTFLRSL